MDDPEEIIERWEKQVEKEDNESMLKCIQQDLRMEMDDWENIVNRYDDLIDRIDEKLGEIK